MGNILHLSKLTQNAQEVSKEVYKTINAFTDEQSFIECDKFVLSQTDLGDGYGDGVVCGFGLIEDIQVGIFAINSSILKGSIGKTNSNKIVKLVKNAISMNAPVVGIIDTQGARFSEGIEAMEGYSAIIKAFSEAYGVVPTICVIKGNNLGLSSYLTAVCDCAIAYDKAVIATSSPLILAANSKIDLAKIGTIGTHTTLTGLISVVVKNDTDLKNALTNYLNFFYSPISDSDDDANRSIINLSNTSKALDIINEACDKNSFYEIRKGFTQEIITGYARLDGIAVGIVACFGKLSANGAIKICDFLNTCDSFGIPVVNIVDCAGSENNLEAENGGLIREIANMLYTYNMLDVAKISLITGSAIGLGYTAFCSKSTFDYTIAWENASINVLSDMAAANLLYGKEINTAKDKNMTALSLSESYGAENSCATVVAQKGYIDNVINIEETRQYLIRAVQMFLSKRA